MDIIGVICVRPALDPCEQAFDTGAVATNDVANAIDYTRRHNVYNMIAFHHEPLAVMIFLIFRHQIFRTGQDKGIQILLLGLTIQILRQAFIGFAGNGRQRQIPAVAKRPIT
nr:hypothetical protein [Nitrosomonas nitrosa]